MNEIEKEQLKKSFTDIYVGAYELTQSMLTDNAVKADSEIWKRALKLQDIISEEGCKNRLYGFLNEAYKIVDQRKGENTENEKP